MSVSGNLIDSNKNLLSGTYATTSDLSSYITSSSLSSTLSSYVTTSTLTSRLSSYVTYSSMYSYVDDMATCVIRPIDASSSSAVGLSSSNPIPLDAIYNWIYIYNLSISNYTGTSLYWSNDLGGDGMYCYIFKNITTSTSGWTSYTTSSGGAYLRRMLSPTQYQSATGSSGSFTLYPFGVATSITSVGSAGSMAGTIYYPTLLTVMMLIIAPASTWITTSLSANLLSVGSDEDEAIGNNSVVRCNNSNINDGV